MEIPVDVRPVWRRRVRAHLCAVPAASGSAGHDDGIRRRPRGAGQPPPHVSEARAQGPEVAHPRLCGLLRQHRAHGVLHRRDGLDRLLLRQVPDRPDRKPRLRRHDHESGRQRHLSGRHGHRCVHDPLLQPAGRSGAHLQVYDDAAAGADGRARRPQRDTLGRGRGSEVLSRARFLQDHRHGHRRRDEPGVLHALGRHGLDGHLRQLHRQGALAARRVGQRHRARYVRRHRRGPHHVPGLLHLRAGGQRGPEPAV